MEEQPASRCPTWPKTTRVSTPFGSSPSTAPLNTAPTCLSQVILASRPSSALSLSFLLPSFMSLGPRPTDAAPSAPGAPGAPMSVKAFDVNSDYVLVAWKPPNTVNEAPIVGYFVDR